MSEKKKGTEKAGGKTAVSPYEEYTEKQIKAAFDVFDEDRNGRAKLKHLGTILRALGRVVTKADLKSIGEKLEDPEFPKYMRVESLLPVAAKILSHDSFRSASLSTLLEAFRKIDKEGAGYIDAEYLKRIFKEYGDGIEDDIIENMITDFVVPGTRNINYKELCKQLVVPPCFDVADNRRKIRLELSRESSRNT